MPLHLSEVDLPTRLAPGKGMEEARAPAAASVNGLEHPP